ncbi:DUF2852 domain-containing protein [Pseudooceanicola sp.]|uniref:DUF2852 domain-containing protein n=1 Tax=Pseudooceanicola sp. TaxID=1914328 RepID=UPI00261C66C2|nr:DUF2852 domain-containing protein [Pseudooceanicola sp.]MDF1854917.1 DUF2852 domain-containing protein [Pseudooceanicola sp.]
MTPASATTYGSDRATSWLGKSEAWLDNKGRGAWIAAMVLGFVFFWPVGLALLAYMIWSKRMFSKSCRQHGRHHHMRRSGYAAMKTSGNTAFDAYKSETLQRLEQEQEAFEAFLQRLRDAKDKAEFDEFMDDRAQRARQEPADDRRDA